MSAVEGSDGNIREDRREISGSFGVSDVSGRFFGFVSIQFRVPDGFRALCCKGQNGVGTQKGIESSRYDIF